MKIRLQRWHVASAGVAQSLMAAAFRGFAARFGKCLGIHALFAGVGKEDHVTDALDASKHHD
jgi:hypothetical protein